MGCTRVVDSIIRAGLSTAIDGTESTVIFVGSVSLPHPTPIDPISLRVGDQPFKLKVRVRIPVGSPIVGIAPDFLPRSSNGQDITFSM